MGTEAVAVAEAKGRCQTFKELVGIVVVVIIVVK